MYLGIENGFLCVCLMSVYGREIYTFIIYIFKFIYVSFLFEIFTLICVHN